MYKEIFHRMLPIFIGSFAGMFVAAYGMYLLGWEDGWTALQLSFLIFVIYMCVRFYSTRKSVLAEKLSAHTLITPLPIVYAGPKGLYSRPYLDFEKMDKVWGIEIGDTFFKATTEKSVGTDYISSYSAVLEILHSQNKRNVLVEYTLPKPDVFECVKTRREHFTATVMLLHKFGIKADDWANDCYWGFFPDMQPCIFNLHPQNKSGAQHIEDENRAFLRLAAK